MSARASVSAIVLAGGRGLRLGGVEKAWLTWRGGYLIEAVAAGLREQVDEIIVVANAGHERFAGLGLRVVADGRTPGQGPLVGLEAGMRNCQSNWVLSVPVDAPHLPDDLVALLLASASANSGARAADAEGVQPLVALYRRASVLPSLSAALDSGERAVHRWQRGLELASHDWSPLRFGNLNTPLDLQSERTAS